jgi:hypothetical protein
MIPLQACAMVLGQPRKAFVRRGRKGPTPIKERPRIEIGGKSFDVFLRARAIFKQRDEDKQTIRDMWNNNRVWRRMQDREVVFKSTGVRICNLSRGVQVLAR